jgi:Phospholipase/Carboxylesterase
MDGLPNTRYVLPTAASVPVSLNMGMEMPSWFDLYGLSPSAPDDAEGIEKGVQRVHRIIDGSYIRFPSSLTNDVQALQHGQIEAHMPPMD